MTKHLDVDLLLKLNSLGYSLTYIGEQLGSNKHNLSRKLRSLEIPPADTRRSFMEDICNTLSKNQIDWLANQLSPSHTIKQYVRGLIINEYVRSKNESK